MKTTFFDLRAFSDKARSLRAAVIGSLPNLTYERAIDELKGIPGSPIAYSASEKITTVFKSVPRWTESGRSAHQGLATADNFRFVRSWWEVSDSATHWKPLSKGSNRVPFYCELTLVMNWRDDGAEMKSWAGTLYNNSHWSRIMMNYPLYFQPGITYSRRPHLRGWFQFLPQGSIFSTDSPIIVGRPLPLLKAEAAILNSSAFSALLGLLMARGASGGQTLKYETGYVSSVPVPNISDDVIVELDALVSRGFRLACSIESLDECSRYFSLPLVLLERIVKQQGQSELDEVLKEIDQIANSLYGLTDADLASLQVSNGAATEGAAEDGAADDEAEDDSSSSIDQIAGLLSWAVGVACGRFDWRVATGERAVPTAPASFDPLPAKSPGMLPDGAEPFYAYPGILVDDPGHPYDLARLVEEVLGRVAAPIPSEVRRWLQRDFFPLHLQRYSKSRRKAPIYWPLSTASGSYTLWVYYPTLTSQTLYTAVNDFIDSPDGKLKRVASELAVLRNKGGARTRDDEKQLEGLQALESEMIELRDTLLQIAPTYRPYHDDGVQITAAPLWSLFRHKPWQKLLKDTWAKLERGDYDWAHLAMAYWPERVREKCKNEKSLAIAHGLEALYVEPEPKTTKKPRGAK